VGPRDDKITYAIGKDMTSKAVHPTYLSVSVH